MPRLTSVDLRYGPTIDVRFTTSMPLARSCDTAVLQLTDAASSGSELGIRIERGRVVDFYVWDNERRLRQRLPLDDVTLDGRHVSFSMPRSIAPVMRGVPLPVAALVVNGAPVQSRFAVHVGSRAAVSTAAAVPAPRETVLN